MTPLEYEQSKALVKILKKRFPNLNTEEALSLTFEIMSAMEKAGKHE